LAGTIINLAQNFCGTNNISLLYPSGQFGTRKQGGKDAASPRYIFTNLPKLTWQIFHQDDMNLLCYLYEEGKKIEPEFYVPIIPMVLVNGAEGIATGYSTNIPQFNPADIVDQIWNRMKGEPF